MFPETFIKYILNKGRNYTRLFSKKKIKIHEKF